MSQDFFILLKNECDFISVFVIDTQEKLPSIFIFYVNPPSSKSPCDGRLVHSKIHVERTIPNKDNVSVLNELVPLGQNHEDDTGNHLAKKSNQQYLNWKQLIDQ